MDSVVMDNVTYAYDKFSVRSHMTVQLFVSQYWSCDMANNVNIAIVCVLPSIISNSQYLMNKSMFCSDQYESYIAH